MKKGTIVSLIVAVALVLMGSILVTLGFSYAGGLEDMTMQAEKTYVVKEPFTSIQVDTTVCDVTFVKTDGEFRAVCPDSKKLSYTVTVEGNTLHVRQVDLRRWYDFIGIHLGRQEMTLHLPESQYDALRIDNDTGDVFVPEDFSFTVAEVFTSTGDVNFSAGVSERLTTSASTGHISIRGSSPAMAQISASTGSVTLQDMACGDCFIKTTTGKVTIADLTCQTLDCESGTGNKYLKEVVAEQYIKAISTTGKLELLGCDAPELTIRTSTGDVTGVLLTPKEFFANTGTGKVRIADHSGTVNGKCYVNSSTGDITFSYQE